MTIERNGRAAIVIGIPLERANVTYFELDPMREVHDALSSVRLALILAGGICYTVGAIVLALRRPDPWPRTFGYHEVFHAFTVVAATLQFIAVASVVVPLL